MEKGVELDPAAEFPKFWWKHGSLKIMAKDHIQKIDETGKAICTICKDSDGKQLFYHGLEDSDLSFVLQEACYYDWLLGWESGDAWNCCLQQYVHVFF